MWVQYVMSDSFMSDAFLADSVLITFARLIARSVSLSQPGSLERHQGRSDGGISVFIIYPPKIRPGKFLWSKNDVLMVIDLIIYIIIPSQKSSTMSFENLYPPPKKNSGYAPERHV